MDIKKDNQEVAIKVSSISKDFVLPHESANSIKSRLINFRKRGYEIQHVLKNLTFEVKKGEFLGIVGRNGSGKSTLLKILAGIYTPTSGSIEVNGKLTPFIELGVGFNPELSGRDNVFLNGALLGFTRKEMEGFYDEIVEFAELERFMDQKLKNYSSGMQVRLAFSIAIRANTDILVLDEVLAVGDEAFQRKCFAYFAELKRNNKTVILVTHSMDSVQQFCDRAILIDKGHKMIAGSPLEISQIYRELNDESGVTVNRNTKQIDKPIGSKYVDAKVECTKNDRSIVFDILLSPRLPIDDPVFAFGLYRDNGEPVYRWASDEKLHGDFDLKRERKIRIKIDDILPVGEFVASIFIKKKDRTVDYAVFNEVVKFKSVNTTPHVRNVLWRIPDEVSIDDKEISGVHRR